MRGGALLHHLPFIAIRDGVADTACLGDTQFISLPRDRPLPGNGCTDAGTLTLGLLSD